VSTQNPEPPYNAPYDLDPVPNGPEGAAEADRRSAFFRDVDPFPNLPPALLSSEHIADYVRVTGMLHPFFPDGDRLKPASYEARARRFIRWDDEGRKIVKDVRPCDTYVLPENSITFVQIESKIRLPAYLALRFNLRITHVHRGLLLGTGPLVDPTFKGDLLIPLHNLTAEKYVIKADEGIIWIEFTKTTHDPRWPPIRGQFFAVEGRKTDVEAERYFERANNNNPIQSSIPSAIKDARELAQKADLSAKRAVRTNRLFASIGVLAIAGLLVGAMSFAVSVVRDAAQASADARRALAENEDLKRSAIEMRAQLEALLNQVSKTQPTLNPPPSQPNVSPPSPAR